jgi:hypothetical protein
VIDSFLDAMIDRVPLLLLLGVLALAAHVAIVEVSDPGRLVASLPAAALAVLYLRAGSRAGGRADGGGSGSGGERGGRRR